MSLGFKRLRGLYAISVYFIILLFYYSIMSSLSLFVSLQHKLRFHLWMQYVKPLYTLMMRVFTSLDIFRFVIMDVPCNERICLSIVSLMCSSWTQNGMSTEEPQFDQHNWGGGHMVKRVARCRINFINHKNFISFFFSFYFLSNLC